MEFSKVNRCISFLGIFLFVLLASNSTAQYRYSFGITVGGLAYHPQANASNTNFKKSLDKNKRLTPYYGVAFHFAYFANDYLGFKITQMFLPYDCAGRISSITQMGINMQDKIIGIKSQKHNVSAILGPMLYARFGWNKNLNYVQDTNFIHYYFNKNAELKFIWYAAHIQYDYFITKSQAFSMQLFPAYPNILTVLAGYNQLIK